MDHSPVMPELVKTLGLTVSGDEAALNREWLAAIVNDLLARDFDRLVFLLYRMDVDEEKLKRLLKENAGSDAGLIIADLMIERQLQKIKSKEQTLRKEDTDIDEDEKW
jgi:hypothetical protein